MPRPSLEKSVVEKVAHIYDKKMKSGVNVTAKLVYDGMRTQYGNYCSLRTVSTLVRNFRKRGLPKESPWEPWESTENVEDVGFLMSLNLIFRTIHGRPLSRTEAKWGSRLQAMLSDYSLLFGVYVISLYALKETVSRLTGETMVTEGLDSWLTARSQYGVETYQHLVGTGFLAAPPNWEEIEMLLDGVEKTYSEELKGFFRDLSEDDKEDPLSVLASGAGEELLERSLAFAIQVRSDALRPDINVGADSINTSKITNQVTYFSVQLGQNIGKE